MVIPCNRPWLTVTWCAAVVVRVGDRIQAAGDSPLPDVIEKARNVADFSLRLALMEKLTARLDAKNLFDSPFNTIQGTATRELYHTGRTFQLGFQVRP